MYEMTAGEIRSGAEAVAAALFQEAEEEEITVEERGGEAVAGRREGGRGAERLDTTALGKSGAGAK